MHFIKGFAKIASPLYTLTLGENVSQKRKAVTWTPQCNEAFKKLKQACTSTPILAFMDFTKPFKLYTYASTTDLGAVLYQEQEGVKQVISSAS